MQLRIAVALLAILGGSSPSALASEIPFAPASTVSSTAAGARAVAVGDLDGDGDPDLASASSEDDTIAWYENLGGSPPTFTTRVTEDVADEAVSVFAASQAAERRDSL